MSTLTELITRVEDRLSMVSGQGTQIYAEDRIAEMIQHKFDVLFTEEFWPQFCRWAQYTLDGTLGVITTDLTSLVKDVEDIQAIFHNTNSSPIPKLNPSTVNPFGLSGARPLHYEGLSTSFTNYASRVFHIWPHTATGILTMRYRTKPDTFVATDEIYFDDQALILGAVFDYLEDDGTNSNATQKFQAMFEARVMQLKDSLNSGPLSLDPAAGLPATFAFTELSS
jgi:hypothetical protein